MTDEQRRQLFETLLGDVSMFAPDHAARLALEAYTLKDVNEIEPLIDRWIAERIARVK